MSMSIKKGDKAPDFQLFASDRSEVSLSTLKGQNVVILFFPLAFTGTCTKELCAMRDNLSVYNALNATILAISVDSAQTLAKFKEEHQLNFQLLSDFNKDVSMAYGVLYDEFVLGMRGVSKRSAFVVDKAGVVRYAEVLEVASELPDFEAITDALSRLN